MVCLALLYRTRKTESSRPARRSRRNDRMICLVIKRCKYCLNVMYNKYEWRCTYTKNSTCMLLRKFQREKTLGEMWAAVIRTINNLLRTAWLRTQAPDWGQSQSQLMLTRGPCWTYSRGASRRRQPKYVHCSSSVQVSKRKSQQIPSLLSRCQLINIPKAKQSHCNATTRLRVPFWNPSPCTYVQRIFV